MGSFIIALIIIFIVWPMIKVGWRIYRMQSQARQIFSQMNNARNAAAEPSQRKAGWSKPAAGKRKKIDADTGEYVSFENIRVTSEESRGSGTATESHTEFRAESQISDAEWEDIS